MEKRRVDPNELEEVVRRTYAKLKYLQQDIPPDFVKVINENFWDLIDTEKEEKDGRNRNRKLYAVRSKKRN